MSYFFSYKKLIEYDKKEADKDNVVNNIQEPEQSQQSQQSQQLQQHMTDAQSLTISTLTTNSDEFKILFLTQEKICYELRSENTILKNQLKMNISTNKKQLQEIKRLKLKMCKLESANTTFEKILIHYNGNNGNNGNHFALPPPPPPFPPPPPPPLPLNTVIKQKILPLMPMNTVLEEFKSKFKPKD
uniref:Uncharacterized protein n=1 Tax=viral metagenome TaxID=1070528 RepID=A0A6C0F1L6_9ZZZZ